LATLIKVHSLNPLTIAFLKHSAFVNKFASTIRFYKTGGHFVGITVWFPAAHVQFDEWDPRKGSVASVSIEVTFDQDQIIFRFAKLGGENTYLVINSTGTWVFAGVSRESESFAGELDEVAAQHVQDSSELAALLALEFLMCQGELTSEQCEKFWLRSYFAYQDAYNLP
jgi:hypothetical protein